MPRAYPMLLLLPLTLAIGCSSAPTAEIRALQCRIEADPDCGSAECRLALDERGGCDGEIEALRALERPELGACLGDCPHRVSCGGGLFPGVVHAECDCAADCIGRESDAYQQAYLEWLVCQTPEACRPH